MKKGKRKKRARSQVREAFVRGFVATALLAILDRPARAQGGPARNSIQRGLKGGLAVASGTVVAEALQERKYSRPLLALAAAAIGIVIVDRYSAENEIIEAGQVNGKEKEVEQVQG